MLLLRATLCPEIATSHRGKSRFSAEQVSPSRQQEEAANLSTTCMPRHARGGDAGGRSTQLPSVSSTAPCCNAWEGEHSPGAAPPCPQASCTRTPGTFCPLGALQDSLSTEQVPAISYGLAAGQLQWERLALPQAGGVHPWSFLLRERSQGIQQPHSLRVTTTPKKLSFL